MSKIIRITKCDECPWYREHAEDDAYCVGIHSVEDSRSAIITDPSAIKENCPLEDAK